MFLLVSFQTVKFTRKAKSSRSDDEVTPHKLKRRITFATPETIFPGQDIEFKAFRPTDLEFDNNVSQFCLSPATFRNDRQKMDIRRRDYYHL